MVATSWFQSRSCSEVVGIPSRKPPELSLPRRGDWPIEGDTTAGPLHDERRIKPRMTLVLSDASFKFCITFRLLAASPILWLITNKHPFWLPPMAHIVVRPSAQEVKAPDLKPVTVLSAMNCRQRDKSDFQQAGLDLLLV